MRIDRVLLLLNILSIPRSQGATSGALMVLISRHVDHSRHVKVTQTILLHVSRISGVRDFSSRRQVIISGGHTSC
jgi:hypothetical protein